MISKWEYIQDSVARLEDPTPFIDLWLELELMLKGMCTFYRVL